MSARQRRDEARTQLADGIDPSYKRKAEKLSNANTFRAIAEEWLALQKDKLHVRTFDKAKYQLESFVYPRLGPAQLGRRIFATSEISNRNCGRESELDIDASKHSRANSGKTMNPRRH